MAVVRIDNCHRVRSRAARSLVRDSPANGHFKEWASTIGELSTRFTDESGLVQLVRVPPFAHANFNLDDVHPDAKTGRTDVGALLYVLSLPRICSPSVRRDGDIFFF
jgi:hypothetical protein